MKRIDHSTRVGLFAVLFLCDSAIAQWVPTGGPVGSSITCFATMPGRIFAGTEAGAVFQSTDGGGTWRFAAMRLTSLGIRSLATLDTVLFAATGGIGIFRTVDYGAVWSPFNGGLTDMEVNALASNDSTLFAATQTQGVFRWMNYGNWSFIFPAANVRALVASGSEILAGAYGAGVFRSTDNGTSWSAANGGLTSNTVQALAYNGTLLLAATTNGVFRSTNRGTNWTATGLTASTLSLAIAGNIQLAGTTAGSIYRSSDFGATWVPAFDARKQINALIAQGPALFAGVQDNGVFRSSDGGAQWLSANTGITNTTIFGIAALDTAVVCITNQSKVFRSLNNGRIWDDQTAAIPQFAAGVIASPNAFLIGTSFDLYGSVYRSTDLGTSWTSVFSGGGVYSLSGRGQNVFVGTSSLGGYNAYRSTSGGTLWTSLGAIYGRAFTIFNSVLFAGHNRSTDNGLTWTLMSIPTPVVAYAVHDSMLFAGTGSAGAFRSTDAGITWENVGFQSNTVAGFVSLGRSLFAAALGTVYRTTDNGASWIPVNEGLPDAITIAAGRTHLYAGTSGSGVWRRPLSEIVLGVQNEADQTPRVFALEQNYPNPFNAGTKIRFKIQDYEFVSLKVYDMLGREVATLVSQKFDPGTYTVHWDAGEQASGVYLARLTAGSVSAVRKIVLVR